MNKKFRLILLICALVILVGSASFVLAQTALATSNNKEEIKELNKEIEDRKSKIKELEKTIEQYKGNIAQKQTEAISLRNQLSILDNRVAQYQADIDLTEERIKEAELEIEALQLAIEDKLEVIDRQKFVITKMVQQIHLNDQKNHLEILFTYDNFADFYNELKELESVYLDLGNSVRSVRIAKEGLQDKKTQIEKKQESFEDLKNELEHKKSDLNENAAVKENLLLQTRSSERRFRTLLESLRSQYKLIEDEVRTFEDRIRQKLAAEDKIQQGGNVLLSWPVPSRYITSYFHDPDYPYRRIFEHNAIDIRAAQGTPVTAAAGGYVARARHCTSSQCYSYIIIIHTGNLSTVYGHLSSISVNADEFVNRGDVIGLSGGTPGTVGAGPFVTGPHLHFETRLNGIPVNPLNYIAQ